MSDEQTGGTDGAETDVERLQAAFAASQEQLLVLERRLAQSQRVAALGALVARLAHELGTPLHSIAGHLDLMLSDPTFPASLRERSEIVAGEVDRLSTLIRGYLRRLRAPEPEGAPTDVNALVRGILAVLEPILDARSIETELDLEPAAAAPFSCDRGQVEQVVLNLVQNAIDALPDGGRITIRTSVTERGRAISLSDSGVGIPPERQERVFEPFFTTKDAGRGSGLGLAICREIARSHGGDVLLDSVPGHGTVVTLTLLPIETAASP